jgi:hypothetical protein
LQYFHLIDKVDRRKKYFKGVQSLYSVVFVSHRDITFSKSRHLACFCKEYMDDNSDFCVQKIACQRMEAGDLGTKEFDEGILLTQFANILLSFLVGMSTVLEFHYSLNHALLFTSLFTK